MATVDEAKTALAKKDEPKSLAALINESSKELGRALQDQTRGERFARIALTNIRINPKLLQCTPESFLGALFTAAQLGIEPVAGRAYLIPFSNNRKKADGSWHKVLECQFVMGYKGLVDLFYRHEKSVMLNWGVVKDGDAFEYELGTNAYLKHRPGKDAAAKVLGFYVIAELKGGAKPFMYMTLEECMAHGREHSKTWVTKKWDEKKGRMVDCDPQWAADSPWATDPEPMCLKTVLGQLSKVLPLSVELQRALAADETSREFRKGIDNAFDLPVTTNWQDRGLPEAPKEGSETHAAPVGTEVIGKDDKPIGFGD